MQQAHEANDRGAGCGPILFQDISLRARTLAGVAVMALGLASGGPLQAQPISRTPEEEDAIKKSFILFDDNVTITAPDGASDISFTATGFALLQPANVLWVIRPGEPGILGVASRPIRDTAKAAEVLSKHGEDAIRRPAALQVAGSTIYAVDASGMLYVIGNDRADSLRVGEGVVGAVDIAVGLSGVVYVLWGNTISIYDPPNAQPFWSFEVDADMRPAVALGAAAWGELIVAGQGDVPLAAYELGASGRFTRTRTLARGQVSIGQIGGMCLVPAMIVPDSLREAWTHEDQFLLLSGPDTGKIELLETRTFHRVAERNLRDELPFAAPGRLDVSNRGQIAFVDARTGSAQVTRVRLALGMIENTDITWRDLSPRTRTQRIGGGGEPSIKRGPSGG